MKQIFYFLHFLIILFFIVFFSSETYAAVPVPGGGYWYRGNSHNHPETTSSTGIQSFANTYKNAGYDFIVLSDHGWSVPCSTQESSSSSGFLVLCGSELGSNSGHIGAFGLNTIVSAGGSAQEVVNRTLNAGGVPVKNHPISNGWSASQFLGVNNLNHFEVANGKRMSQIPSAEVLWDEILSASNGRPTYGIGTDDNHSGSPFKKAWIMVMANSLTKSQIVENFRSGNFYASSGVTLSDYKVNYTNKTITIASDGDKITFIGKNGATLKTISSGQGSYQADGSEKYIRAKVTNSSGKAAWTQPVYFSGPVPTSPQATNTPVPTGLGTPGDANEDGVVDIEDYTIWLNNYKQSKQGVQFGDFNNSGKVDGKDYTIWLINYGS
jgi:hypothetical protein